MDVSTLRGDARTFLTPDPLGVGAEPEGRPTSANLFAYVGNDPLNYQDPLGLSREEDGSCLFRFDRECLTPNVGGLLPLAAIDLEDIQDIAQLVEVVWTGTDLPNLPNLPDLPAFDNTLPFVPPGGLDLPNLPDLPDLPDLSNLPTVPGLGSLLGSNNKDRWTCDCKCQLAGPGADCEGYIYGSGTGNTQADASKAGKKACGPIPPGCYKRHCQCNCRKT